MVTTNDKNASSQFKKLNITQCFEHTHTDAGRKRAVSKPDIIGLAKLGSNHSISGS